MSVESWNGGSGGWGTVANWTGGIPNSTTADATIATGGTYTVTIESGKSYTVDSVGLANSTTLLDVAGTLALGGTEALMNIAAGTLELAGVVSGGAVDINNGATLLALGGALTGGKSFYLGGSGYLNLNGHALTLGGTSNLLGYVIGSGDLVVSGLATLSDDSYFEAGVTLDDTGTVIATTSNQFADSGAAVALLTIASTGTYDIAAPNVALNDNGTFDIVNAGLFEMTGTSTPDGYVNVYNNSFANTGTISVVTGSDISLLQGHEDLAGEVIGAGDIYIGDGATATLEAGLSLNVGILTFSDGNTEIILESNRVFGQTLELQNNAELQLNGYSATLSGQGALNAYVSGPGSLDVTGTYLAGGLLLGTGVTETLAGIEIQNGETRFNYPSGTAATVLTITSTGTYDITTDSNIDASGAAAIIDSGLFEKTGYDNYTNIIPNFTETSGGTIAAAAGNDISLLGATNDIAGTITGAGEFYFGNGGSDTLEASAVISSIANFAVSDGGTQLTLESNRVYGGIFADQNNGAVLLNGNTLTLAGKSQFTNGYVSGSGALVLSGTSDFDNFYAEGALTVVDLGTITQDGADELGINGSADVVLSIAAGAVYDILDDIYINPQGTSAIDNAGLFEKTGGNGNVSDIYAPVDNLSTGTIEAALGLLRLDNGGTLNGTLAGAGILDLNGGIFTLSAGAVLDSQNLDVTGAELLLKSARGFAGAFSLNGGTVNLNGFNLSLNNPADYLANGYIYGPGTLSEAGRADVNFVYLTGGAVLKDTGTITQDGPLYIGNYAADTAALSISATGIYDLVNDNNIYASGNGTINNAGLFEKTAGEAVSNIAAAFNNAATATLDSAEGQIQLLDGGSLAGTLAGGGILYLGGGTFSLAAAAVVKVATLYIDGGQLNLLGATTFTNTFIETAGDLNLNGFNATLTGNDTLENAYLTGPGTLTVTGTTELKNYNLTGGAVLQDAGTIIADGNFYPGVAANDTGTLNIGVGAVYDIINDSYIYNSGNGVVNNAGLLEKTADNSASNIYTPINNTGTLAVARGVIDLVDGGTLGGTLTGGGTLELGGGNFVLLSAAVLGVAQINLYNAALSLQNNRAYSGGFNEYYGGGNIQLNGHTLTLSGTDSLNGYVSGPGTLAITGTADLNGYNLTSGAVLDDTGTITVDGAVQIGEASTDTATLSIASTGTFAILNDSYIYEDGTVAVLNAGLFEKTGSSTARSDVQGAFTNTGAIALTSGILEVRTLTNDALVTVANALLQTDSTVSADAGKAGTIRLGGSATLDEGSGIAASQTIALSGTSNQIEIGDGSLFKGTITGFTFGDTIDLLNTLANGFSYANNLLTLTENGAAVTIIALAGITTPGSISLLSDGATGTSIEFGNPGSVTVPHGAITNDRWTAGSGDFNTGGNWSGGVPGTLSNASFASNLGSITVTDAASSTIYSLQGQDTSATFAQSAGTLSVIDGGNFNGTFKQTGGEILVASGLLQLYNGGTIAGTFGGAGAITVGTQNSVITLAASAVLGGGGFGLNYAATLALESNRVYAGSFSSANYTTIALDGFNLSLTGATNLNYGDVIDGPGTLTLAGPSQIFNFNIDQAAALDVTGTTTQLSSLMIGNTVTDTSLLSIASTGVYNIIADSNVVGTGLASIDNAGLLEKTGDNGQTNIQTVAITQTSSGTIDVAQGSLLFNGDNGYFGGTLTGAGEIEFAGSNITLAPAAVLNAAALSLSASDFFLTTNATYAGAFAMANGGTLELGHSNLTLTGAAALGNVYIGGSGTIVITGQADITGAQLINSAQLVDAGTIVLDGGFAIGYYATDTSALVINAGAVYDIINDSNIDASGTASIYNGGLFEKAADNGYSYIAPVFTNASTGTIDVVAGVLDLQSGGTLNGTIEGAGQLYLQNNNGTFTLGAGAVLSVATLNANEALLLQGSHSYAGTFIDTNNVELNGNNLTLTGGAALDSYVQGNGTLIAAHADVAGLYEYNNAVVVDQGTLTQDGGYSIGNTATDTSSLSIVSGAIYDLLTDNSINANGTASAINNAGLFEKTGDYGNSNIYAGFTNTGTGTIDVARGFLTFLDGGTFNGTLIGGTDGSIADGGIIADGGVFNLGSAAVVKVAELGVANGTLSLGAGLNYAGYFDGTGGSLALNGHSVTLTSPYLGAFYLAGPGTMSVSGTSTLNSLGQINGSTLLDKGTIIQDGGYQIGYSATDASELSITGSGVFNVVTDNFVGANGAAAKVINSGVFEKSADNGYSDIQASFTNQASGIIDVTHGDLGFSGGGVLGGTLEGAGEIQLNGPDTLASSVVTVGTLVIAATSTLTTNLTYGNDFVLNFDESLILQSHALVLNGTASLIGGFEGPGTVTVNGDATVNTADLYGGATLIDNGYINQTDELRFSLNDNSSDTLSITSAGTYNIQNDSNFHNYGNATVNEIVSNAGLLEKTGDTGLSNLQVTLTNTGTVLVTSGTLLVDTISNLAAGTLTGGTWIADTGFLAPVLSLAGGGIAVDAAAITLSGANSELIAGGTLLERSLTSITAAGVLAVDGGRNFIAGNAVTDGGNIILQGGTFAAPALTIAAGGTFAGYGTLAAPVLDNGLLAVTDPTLTVAGAITGTGSLLIDPHSELILGSGAASGTSITFGGSIAVLGLDAPSSVLGTLVSLAPSDTIDLIGTLAKSATITGNVLAVSLSTGGTIDYTLANPAATIRAAVVSDGNGGSDIAIFRQAHAGAISPTPVDLGEHHTGSTVSQTYTIANTASVDPYSENLNATMGATSANITASGSFTGLAPGATNSTALHASLVTTTGGLISGTAAVNLYTTGTGVAGDDTGTMALPPATVSLTGTIFNYATGVVTPKPLSLGQHHVGDAISQFITIANGAAGGIYSENLDAKFSGTSTNITSSGTLTGLAAGAANSSALDLSLNSGSSGVKSGTVTIGLTSDGAGIDTLGNTGLTAQTVTVSGTLFNYATAKTAATFNFGERHAGTSVAKFITISNHAATGSYSENLDVSFAGSSAGFAGSGHVTTLTAGATNSSKLDLTLTPGTAGLDTGSTTLSLTSDGTGIDSLGTTGLGTVTIATTGTLFNLATAAIKPSPLSFGERHVGDAVSQSITIANTAAPGIYSENLDASFSGTSIDLTGSGSFTGLAAGASNSTALAITLNSGTAGVASGHATIKLTSDAAGIDTLANTGLTTQTVAVSGTLFNYATASAPGTINFGIVHVGATVGQYLTLSNTAATGKYSENLDAGFSGTTGPLTTSGTLSELAAGATSSTDLKLKLASNTAGTIAGTATLALTSDGKTIDTLGTTSLGGEVFNVTGTVNNYATTALETLSGPGALSGSGTTLHLDLGSTTKGSAALTENIGVLNGAAGPADLLAGSFTTSGSSLFTNNSFSAFSGLAAGGADASPTISLGTGTIGTFHETIVVHGTGSNASGYSGAITNETLIVVGTVKAAPMMFIAAPASSAGADAVPLTGSAAVQTLPALQPGSPDLGGATSLASGGWSGGSGFSLSSTALGGYLSSDLSSLMAHGAGHSIVLAAPG